MSDLWSKDKRKRAVRLREIAIGSDDYTARPMIELAQKLEDEAAAEERKPDGRDHVPSQPEN